MLNTFWTDTSFRSDSAYRPYVVMLATGRPCRCPRTWSRRCTNVRTSSWPLESVTPSPHRFARRLTWAGHAWLTKVTHHPSRDPIRVGRRSRGRHIQRSSRTALSKDFQTESRQRMFASPINGRTKVVERRRNRWPTLGNSGWCVSSEIGGKSGLKYAGAEDPNGMQWMHGSRQQVCRSVRRVRFQEQAQTTGESVAPGLPSLPLTSLIEFGSLKTDLLAQAARLASRKEPPFNAVQSL